MVSDNITAPTSVKIRSNDKDSTCKLGATLSVKMVGNAGPTKPWPMAKAPSKSVSARISVLWLVAMCGTKASNKVPIPGTKTAFRPHRSDHAAAGLAQRKHSRFVAARTTEKAKAPRLKTWVSINGTKQ
eukprot:Skav234450  [mRNA]  locus=scaffold1647:85314:85715:- [translate_table: standard]